MRILVLACLLSCASVASAAEQCGEGGVWLQILGSGGPEITDRRASASYVLWVDDQAKVLVDPGPGSSPARIHALARASFAARYDAATLKRWLGVFFSRFYGHQFKRTTLPPGPKVGSLSLSPRGDWRMPDEARADALLAAIARLPD